MDAQLLIAGFIASHTLLLLCFKLGIRKVLGYDAAFDIAATVLLLWMFEGTYSGMIAASFGGLVISVELWILKYYLGYEILLFDPEQRRLVWITHYGKRKRDRV